MKLIPKNWKEFQHYKDRCPPWIKLHRDLLNNYEFAILPLESKAVAPLLWLIASESKDGVIDLSLEALAFRLHIDSKAIATGIKALIDNGFFIDDSNVLAECLQHAIPEREKEREKETETETETEKEVETKTRNKKTNSSAKEYLSYFDINGQLADDFIAHRKRKKAEITKTVMDAFVREAMKAGISLEDAIRISIERNWQLFKADWVADHRDQKRAGVNQQAINSFLGEDF